MTSVPRSFLEFSQGEVEAEERYEAGIRLVWEPEVENHARDFYRDVREPTPYETFEISSTVKLCGEQYRCFFEVQLWEFRGSRSLLHWVTPGQVEVTYIVDGRQWRQKTLDLRLENRDGASVGIFIDYWDDMEEDLEWDNYLLIFLKFDEGTIRYYNPNDPSRELVIVREVMKRHCEIYASPEASRGCEFDDFGFVRSPQASPTNQEQSGSDESSVSW